MHKIKKILFIIPDNFNKSKTLIDTFNFAEKKGAQITFLSALNSPPSEISKIVTHHKKMKLSESVKKLWHQHLDNILKTQIKPNVKYNLKVLTGDRFQMIVDESHKKKYDLLITPYFRTKHTLSEKIFGSKNMFLLRHSPCPVLVLRPKRRKKTYKILVAIDTEDNSPSNTALNQKIIDYAFATVANQHVEIHILQCWSLYGETLLRDGLLYSSRHKLKKILAETEEYYRGCFDSTLEHLPKTTANVQNHLIKGDATEIIPKFCQQNSIDLVVMGTISRTGISSFTIGNTAEDIIQSINCSVLAVKPDDLKINKSK